MNKAKLKEFAVSARKTLMEQIDFKIKWLDPLGEYETQKIADKVIFINNSRKFELSIEDSENRIALKRRILEIGYEQTLEEVAYTWFNRLIAIRYMEVNEFLPLGKNGENVDIRILSNRKTGNFDPEIIEYSNLYNKFIDININYDIVEQCNGNYQEIYPYILVKVCKKLGKVIPLMFDGITDYIDILIPNNLLSENSIIRQLSDLDMITEEDWKEQVEIIGWLYQYYISEKKDEVFSDLKKNIKITKENIPAATQLFTPDWIVKYMVENSLGRMWNDVYDNKELKDKWKYYIDDNTQKKGLKLKPTEISFIDPCMGSGHILVYAFRVFMQIYKTLGYIEEDSVKLILENNIKGLDIDDRAGQLAYFALLMEARKFDKNILKNIPNIDVMAIQESNNIKSESLNIIKINDEIAEIIDYILEIFIDAKEYGSILHVENKEYNKVLDVINEKSNKELNIIEIQEMKEINEKFVPLVKQAILLSRKYSVVVTNPPYMGNRGMSEKLAQYVQKYFKDTKSDMFAIFMERARELAINNGYYAMITQPSFLFLSSFEKLRIKLVNEQTILSLLHMGRGIFGIDFGSVSFVIKNQISKEYKGDYFRLHEKTFQYISPENIENIYLSALKDKEYRVDFSKFKNDDDNDEEIISKKSKIYYHINQEEFRKVPSYTIAYWISDNLMKAFTENKSLSEYGQPRQGLATGENRKFIRQWYEVNYNDIKFDAINKEDALKSNKKWFPYNKGGAYRKWYGNNDYVVNWSNDGKEIKEFKDSNGKLKSRPQNLEYYFKECISWSLISSGSISFRYKENGFIFDVAGMSCFINKNDIYYLLALNNSPIIDAVMSILAPTLNYQVGNIASIPVIMNNEYKDEITKLCMENIQLAKKDWDSYEISWNFEKHPLVKYNECRSIKEAFKMWENETKQDFNKLKENEERINELFIKIYSVENEIIPNVKDENISIRIADKVRDIKSFISYFIGCLMGRYSIDKNKIVYAGGNIEDYFGKYKGQAKLDKDGIAINGGYAGMTNGEYHYADIKMDNEEIKKLSFEPDLDAIIPLNDEEYFEDDVIIKLCDFLNTVYGKDKLEENLEFIANSLGKNGAETSRECIRNYIINGFYEDHCKIYQKRPIYWLLDSGKENGFKALIYIHRYSPDMMAKIRIDYLHKLQRKYETLIDSLDIRMESTNNVSDIKIQEKRKQKYTKQLNETRKYDEKIKHLADKNIKIDLDNGIADNYNEFKEVLSKIK